MKFMEIEELVQFYSLSGKLGPEWLKISTLFSPISSMGHIILTCSYSFYTIFVHFFPKVIGSEGEIAVSLFSRLKINMKIQQLASEK